MFKYRVIGFTLLMALLFGIFFWDFGGTLLFLTTAPAFAAMAIYECCRMLNGSGKENYPVLTAVIFYIAAMAWCLLMGAGLEEIGAFILLAMVLLVPLACGISLFSKQDTMLRKVLTSMGVLVVFAPSFIFFCGSYFYELNNAPRGAWLLFLCLATKATDTGGYIVGTLTSKLPGGNHKIAPSLSPKKSWEGLFGGVLLSLLVGWLFFRYAGYASLWWYLAVSLVLALGSFAGDLAESAVKRMCNIKDSGNWVPGMGGAFDVLDSFIFNGSTFALFVFLNATGII